MKGLALHANVHRLKRVQTHLHLRLLRWLRLRRSSHAHLGELLRHTLDTLLDEVCRALRWIALLRCLISGLWRSILSVCWLPSGSLHSRIAVRRLLRHAISRLLWRWVAIARGRAARSWRAWVLSASRWRTTWRSIGACAELVCLSSVCALLLASRRHCLRLFICAILSLLCAFCVGCAVLIGRLWAGHDRSMCFSSPRLIRIVARRMPLV